MKDNEKVVKIERIVPGGLGIGFADGLTIFVGLAVAGDELKVRIMQKKGKVAFADIAEIITPSPERITPDCEYFGKCGGCDFQQMNYQAQLKAKLSIIQDCLKRIGKIEYQKEIEIIASPDEWGYRSRAQWHADTRTKRLGYFKRGSHQVWDIEKCLVLTPALHKIFDELKTGISWQEFWADNVEIEAASSGEQTSVFSVEIVEPVEKIFFEADGNRYFYNAESFFQGNQSLIPKLIELATKGLEGDSALDLYCGVGLFTLPLAKSFNKVFAVEESQAAVEFAKENAEYGKHTNISVYADTVSNWFLENQEETQELDLVVLDPPRSGAEKEVIAKLLEIKPKNISYVSCDPATLARDLRLLTENAYEIDSITALDLFPQTHHVETVARLKLKN